MTEPDVSVRVFVHADSPVPDRRRRVTSRLSALAETGAIGAYQLELWPKVVSLDAAEDRGTHDVIETYERLTDWAEREGVSIMPPFAVRSDEWQITGEHDRRLHTPHMCLAVYEAEEVTTVYPHRCADGVKTVRDGLAALEPDTAGPQADGPAGGGDDDPDSEYSTQRLETDPEDRPVEPIDG